jgi:hypothetical protein
VLRRRRVIAFLAACALAPLAAVPIAASGAAPHVAFAANGGPPLVRPSILFASPTNGPYAKNLTWEGWGEGRASAEGTVYYDTCEPNCSAGYHSTSGEVVLSGIHRCSGGLRYSQLRIVYFPAPQYDLRASYDCRGTATHVRIGRP